ncbi:MAG: sigma-70 family RNA polymerase sigma factor [Bacteroidota bacterium]|nr:sigma-70 family RNA polymerase sigma factor [Bacteroidota bacterium]
MPQTKGEHITATIQEYSKRLFRFIRGKVATDEDAEDILQDVWYQLSNAVNIEEIEQMSGWLHRVARNKITDSYRKKKPELLDDFAYETEDGGFGFADILLLDSSDPETLYLRDLFWEELFAALDELPQNQKDVFVQNELDNKTLQQIADAANENIKTIISRKGYAIKHLRKRLQNLYDELINY